MNTQSRDTLDCPTEETKLLGQQENLELHSHQQLNMKDQGLYYETLQIANMRLV